MDFIILGGGCFGSFYVKQLLRGCSQLGFGRIHVVDHDPDCRARREFPEEPVFHIQDWKPFLFNYFDEQFARWRRGEEIADHYVPPTFAPHILFELFLEKARRENPALVFRQVPLDLPIGTPVDMVLPAGTRALSFATWTCPATCIEPPTCPHTRGPKDWDMKAYLEKHAVDETLIFQCRHLAMGVGTIPVQKMIDEYVKFQTLIGVPGTHRVAMATVSSCHGLIGLVHVSYAEAPISGRSNDDRNA